MITYNSIGVTYPPLDVKILVKKDNYTFDDAAEVKTMESAMWSNEEEAAMYLLTESFELWAQV
jgi:hypothetical protein